MFQDTRCIECKGYGTRGYMVAILEKGNDKIVFSDHACICDACIETVRKKNPMKLYARVPTIEEQLPDDELFDKIDSILNYIEEYKKIIKTTNEDGKPYFARVLHEKIRKAINTYKAHIMI